MLIWTLLLILSAALSLVGLVYWAAGGFQTVRRFHGEVMQARSGARPTESAPAALTILTWNIAYGHGAGSEGHGYEPHPRAETERRLRGIADVIRDSGADLVLLQEVDFDSGRSNRIDELAFLLEATGYAYAAPAETWKARYIPFPYWPPSHHFGRVRSGAAILSRYPILANEVQLLPKPASYRLLYRLFYLFRFIQAVEIDLGAIPGGRRIVRVINTHLEADDVQTRTEHARALAAWIQDCGSAVSSGDRARTSPLIAFGGDFNTLPPSARRKTGHADMLHVDFAQDTSYSHVAALESFAECVSEADYLADEASYFTFPSHAPARRIDFLFVSKSTPVLRSAVLKSGDLSDHLPLRAEISLTDLASTSPRDG